MFDAKKLKPYLSLSLALAPALMLPSHKLWLSNEAFIQLLTPSLTPLSHWINGHKSQHRCAISMA